MRFLSWWFHANLRVWTKQYNDNLIKIPMHRKTNLSTYFILKILYMFITKRLLTTEKLTKQPKESKTIYPQNLFLAQNPKPWTRSSKPQTQINDPTLPLQNSWILIVLLPTPVPGPVQLFLKGRYLYHSPNVYFTILSRFVQCFEMNCCGTFHHLE